jgi:hypothetical protein
MKSRYNWLLLSLCLPLALPVTAQTQPCSGTGISNTCYGFQAGGSITTGYWNTANGYEALYHNTTGYYNTAVGSEALFYNTTGYYNTANGYYALFSNTTGSSNTANGLQALFYNTTGSSNTANGLQALFYNTTGINNTALGFFALDSNTIGINNTALGYQAGINNTTGSYNIDIGNNGNAKDYNTIRIGSGANQKKAFIAGISGVTASGGVQVFINSNGQLGTLTSSKRFKSDIKDLGTVSDKLMKLRPVEFRYKEAAEDGSHPVQYGLIAEEVAKVYPDLVQYDKDGKPFTVYYHLLTPMLLNEFQKEHQELQQEHLQNVQQKSEIALLKAALKQQASQLTAMKQTQQQQFQMLSKLAMFTQAQSKGHTQKALYRP